MAQRAQLLVLRSGPYLHVVPGGLPSAPDAALQPQWGAQGPMFRVCTQPCAHIADLDKKEAKSGPVSHLEIPAWAPAGVGGGKRGRGITWAECWIILIKLALGWWVGPEPLDKGTQRAAPLNPALS